MSRMRAEKQPWAVEQSVRARTARQHAGIPRLLDPTTIDRQYTEAETEFMLAMDEYKRRTGRPFPTWSEALAVLRGLGYEK